MKKPPTTMASILPHSAQTRREFLKSSAAFVLASAAHLAPFVSAKSSNRGPSTAFDVVAIDRARVLADARRYLAETPVTITSAVSNRTPGGKHDYFSEADYFWPDPKNPNGPYIGRDGMSNPSNFLAHRHFLLRFSVLAPAVTAAWRITGDKTYAQHAAQHLRAWFINGPTRMNPNLQYAQAIRQSTTGARFGVIDTIHLVEVVRATEVLTESRTLSSSELDSVKGWFADYLQWMTTHPFGIDEMESPNNHATCWDMQVASFARFTANAALADYAARRFKSVLLPDQMAPDGSFPQEINRTKPYGYSLFNLDAMATICQLLSTSQDNLWDFHLPDGRGIDRGVAFMAPYIRSKKAWPHSPDVMYYDDWPMRQCSLLFAGLALKRDDYLNLWKTLPAESNVEEVIRNFFIRQPILWVSV